VSVIPPKVAGVLRPLLPELAAETIPGGVQAGDERVGGTATQSSGTGGAANRVQRDDQPEGHREADHVSDDDLRRAGENG